MIELVAAVVVADVEYRGGLTCKGKLVGGERVVIPPDRKEESFQDIAICDANG
jgi:hypothetical protein